ADLRVADQLFTEDARFYWSTNESSFGLVEWREGITQQHSVFEEIEMLDRVITTGEYPDGAPGPRSGRSGRPSTSPPASARAISST
ncbi:MAG: hypothetical protein ACPGPE_02390, partial [Planctomycetota bacterium]